MCYNISIITKIGDLEKHFGARFTQPDLYKTFYHALGFSAPFLPVIPNEDIHAIELFQLGLVPDLFGNINMGTIIGLINTHHMLGMAISAYTSCLIFEVRGNYFLAFLCLGFFEMLAALLAFLIRQRGAKSSM